MIQNKIVFYAGLVALCFAYVQAGGRCGSRMKVNTRRNSDRFDLHIGLSEADVSLKKILRGRKNGVVDLIPGDLLAIDTDNEVFQVKKLCMQVQNANEVHFEFFAEGLEDIIAEDTQSVARVDGEFTEVCSTNLPSQDIQGIFMFFRNNEGQMGQRTPLISVKKFRMKGCM